MYQITFIQSNLLDGAWLLSLKVISMVKQDYFHGSKLYSLAGLLSSVVIYIM